MLDVNDRQVGAGYPLLSVENARIGYEVDGRFNVAVGMRHFYAEWSKRMGRLASDPSKKLETRKHARA